MNPMSDTTLGLSSTVPGLVVIQARNRKEELPELCYPRTDCPSLPGNFKTGGIGTDPPIEQSRLLLEVQDYFFTCPSEKAGACFLRENGFYRDCIDERDVYGSPKKMRARKRILKIIEGMTFEEDFLDGYSDKISEIATDAGLVAAFTIHLGYSHRPAGAEVFKHNEMGPMKSCAPEKIRRIGHERDSNIASRILGLGNQIMEERFGGVKGLLKSAFSLGQSRNGLYSLDSILLSLATWNRLSDKSDPFKRCLRYAFGTTNCKNAILRMIDDEPCGGECRGFHRGDSRCVFFLTSALALGTQGLRKQEVIVMEVLGQLKMIVTDSLRVLRGMRGVGRKGESVLYTKKFRDCYTESYQRGESYYNSSVLLDAERIGEAVKDFPDSISIVISEYFRECIEPLAEIMCGVDFATLRKARLEELKRRASGQMRSSCPGLDGLPLIHMVLPVHDG